MIFAMLCAMIFAYRTSEMQRYSLCAVIRYDIRSVRQSETVKNDIRDVIR